MFGPISRDCSSADNDSAAGRKQPATMSLSPSPVRSPAGDVSPRKASPRARSPSPLDRSPSPGRSKSRSPARNLSPVDRPARSISRDRSISRGRSRSPSRDRRRRSESRDRYRRSRSRDRYRSRSPRGHDRGYGGGGGYRDRGHGGGYGGGYGGRRGYSPPPRRGYGYSPPRRRSPPRSYQSGDRRRPTPPRTGTHLFVAGLNFITNEREVERKFGKYGDVKTARIVRNPYNGESRGFGFVEMADDRGTDEAIDNLDGQEWNGRRLLVERARNVKPGGER
ncbi:hypothetical protein WJX73_006382 [Symbiochloris irregularis]|uniref:RRM domain-containing protein n=1 Tax=Symbiochloris irregularis TaxID=706552 RepID=A0AAW1PCM1_9CHLO